MLVLLGMLRTLIGLSEDAITTSAIVTRVFSSVARSNVNLMSNTLSSKDRDDFTGEMIAMRILF